MITPPPELVAQWADMLSHRSDHDVFAQAARWGANEELEACCEWFQELYKSGDVLRAARRPKPPSLKEQALAVLDDCADRLDGAHENTIRRALEQLND
jgi:hypothetical protein